MKIKKIERKHQRGCWCNVIIVILIIALLVFLSMKERITIVDRPVQTVEKEVVVIQERIEYIEIIEEVIVYEEVEVPIEGTYTEDDMIRAVDEFVSMILAINDHNYEDYQFVYEDDMLFVFKWIGDELKLTETHDYESLKDILIS